VKRDRGIDEDDGGREVSDKGVRRVVRHGCFVERRRRQWGEGRCVD